MSVEMSNHSTDQQLNNNQVVVTTRVRMYARFGKGCGVVG